MKLRTKRRLWAVVGVLLAGGILAAAFSFAFLRELPRFDSLLDYEPKEATRLVTPEGEEVASFSHERRTVVPMDKIPKLLREAVISAEDKEFYSRPGGVSPSGILRALVKRYLLRGRIEGGSTITQQVVKTFLVGSERTFRRKIREAILAERISNHLSKDEILWLYLNQIYFGHERYGVEEAARYYFGKHVWELDVGEAALLAGMPQLPQAYSPIHHPEAAKRRQLYVLHRMREDGWIDAAEEKRWGDAPIVAHPPPAPPGPYYAEEVRRYLEARYGAPLLYEGGLTVTVGMDPELQRAAQSAVAQGLAELDKRERYRATPLPEAAFAAIDPKDRRVLALVGGSDFRKTPFDRAVQAKRQPGSAFKPFVYAAAVESGKYSSASVVLDTPELVRDPVTGTTWRPQNDEKESFEGPMTLRRALAESKNTVAVKLIEGLGAAPVMDLAHRAGIVSELPNSLTLGLGTGEVSLLELVDAYATFDDGGSYAPPRMVLRAVDRKGKLLEDDGLAARPAVKPEVAFVVTDLLRGVIEEPTGTGRRAKDLPGPLAGKTGTATDERDAWFVGYSSSLVAGAWVGFDDHRPLGSYEQGAHAALPIWIAFMKAALARHPPSAFAPPPGIVFATIDPTTGKLAAPGDPDGLSEPFLPGTQPTATALPPGENHDKDLFLRGDTRGAL